MTNEKAMEILVSGGENVSPRDVRSAVYVALSALDKLCPRRARIISKDEDATFGYCPSCVRSPELKYTLMNTAGLKNNYCPRCGQALDWSGNETD